MREKREIFLKIAGYYPRNVIKRQLLRRFSPWTQEWQSVSCLACATATLMALE